MSNEGETMDDRKEKIIALARTMITANKIVPEETKKEKVSLSVPVLFLMTLLTAMGSGAVTS